MMVRAEEEEKQDSKLQFSGIAGKLVSWRSRGFTEQINSEAENNLNFGLAED